MTMWLPWPYTLDNFSKLFFPGIKASTTWILVTSVVDKDSAMYVQLLVVG